MTLRDQCMKLYRSLVGHMVTAELELSDCDKIEAFVNAIRNATLEEAAEISKHHGYTFTYNREFQPWADAANHALRAQNHEIAKLIRALKNPKRE